MNYTVFHLISLKTLTTDLLYKIPLFYRGLYSSHHSWSINCVPASNGVFLNGKSCLLSILLTCPMTLNAGYLFFAWVYSCAELSFTYFLMLLQCLINIYKDL